MHHATILAAAHDTPFQLIMRGQCFPLSADEASDLDQRHRAVPPGPRHRCLSSLLWRALLLFGHRGGEPRCLQPIAQAAKINCYLGRAQADQANMSR